MLYNNMDMESLYTEDWKGSESRIDKLILGMRVIKEGDTIVDLGGGNANYQKKIIKKIPKTRIISIDKDEYKSNNRKIKTIQANITSHNYKPQIKADVVIASRLINNMHQTLYFHEEIATRLKEHTKKDGHLILSYHFGHIKNLSELIPGNNELIHHKLTQLGFKEINSKKLYSKNLPKYWIYTAYQLTK